MTDATDRLVYGRTTAGDRGKIITHEKYWGQIVDLFREPVRRKITTAMYDAMDPKGRADSKNTGLFFGGRCDEKRRDSNLVSRSIVNLDLDDHCDAIWAEYQQEGTLAGLDGLAYLIHTTRSHSADAPKMRILVPLTREISPAEYEPVARALAERLDPKMEAVARESFTPAQGMYFPSASSDQEYAFSSIGGLFFDPDTALATYPATDASCWPKKAKEKPTAYIAGRKMTHPDDKKAQAPIIAAVHRAYDPWTFISEFLEDIYVASGDRYFPIGATGAPSVRIYDSAFIQSDHGSDAAVGQHNTFDLGRIHLYGHLDADYDTASLSPIEWPSYKAMTTFMLKQDPVREALAEVEAEVEAERNSTMSNLLDSLDDDEEGDDLADLLGFDDEDDDEDLLGSVPVAKAPLTIEDVLRKVRAKIAKATTLADLERRIEIIRGFPTTDFRDLHRDLITPDIQRKFLELAEEKITKAAARKMLVPTVENLRDQMAQAETPEWLKDWVLVTSENKLLNLDTKEVLTRDGFNGRFNKNTGDQFGSSDMGLTKLTSYDAATQIFCIPMPYWTKYHPGRPTLFHEDGILCANTYKAAWVEHGSYKGNDGVKLLRRLLRDLFPVKDHQAMVLDFLAHCVQHPEKKLKYSLLVKGSENEGKSLLAKLMRKMVGAHNFSIVGPELLKEKFNGWSYEKLFCVVEEIKITGKEAYEVLNKIKPVITNEEIAIRRMQKDVTTESNYCNMYLTTNFEDCLPLEEDNTRFLVLFTRFRTNQEVMDWRESRVKAEGVDYVKELWRHITEHPYQFQRYFAKYEFSAHYAPEDRAPWTQFKGMMADDAKTDERELLEDILASGSDPSISNDILIWTSFREILDQKGLAPWLRSRAIAGFLKPMGYIKARKTTFREGAEVRNLHVWTRNPELVMADNSLSPEGKHLALEAIRARDELNDLDSLADNVVQMKRR